MTSDGLPVLIIDGNTFDDLEGFAREFSKLLGEHRWQGNLDAFNDILRGGFGTPQDGFVLRWVNSRRSREVLGWDATVSWYEETFIRCRPSNRPEFEHRLQLARQRSGTTLFDWIVEIIRTHGPGGSEAEDRVHLQLG